MPEFNGYTNYETWLISFYYGDDNYLKEMVYRKYKECHHKIYWRETLATYLQSIIEGYYREYKTELDGFLNDLLDNALLNVNYYEIAEMFLNKVKEDIEDA